MIDIIITVGSWALILMGLSISVSFIVFLIIDAVQTKKSAPGKFDKQGTVEYTKGDNT